MDTPRPTEHHARLAVLAGSWRGTDTVHMPDGTRASFAGRYDQRVELDGWFLSVSYEQEASGAVHYRMRAIIGWLADEERYFMHWYDSFGGNSTALRGAWDGDALVIAGPDAAEGGRSRFTWRVSGDRLELAIDSSSDGGVSWVRRLDGAYARAT